jgi:hypothetical protein
LLALGRTDVARYRVSLLTDAGNTGIDHCQ